MIYNKLISLNKEIEHRPSLVISVQEVWRVVRHVVSEDGSLLGPHYKGRTETEGEGAAP